MGNQFVTDDKNHMVDDENQVLEKEKNRVFDEFLKVNPEWKKEYYFCGYFNSTTYAAYKRILVFSTETHKISVFVMDDKRCKISIWFGVEFNDIETNIDINDPTLFHNIKDVLDNNLPSEIRELIPFVDPFALPFVLK